MKVLFASRAYESKKQEGGFVLLLDLAEFIASKNTHIKTYFFARNRINQLGTGVRLLPIFSHTGWSKMRRLEFFIGLLFSQFKYDIVHTAHVPTLLNVTLFRFIKIIGKLAGIKYLQTITAMPVVNDRKLKYLCWGDSIICLSAGVEKRLLKNNIEAAAIIPWPSPNRICFSMDRRKRTRSQIFSGFDKVVLFPGEFSRLGIDSDFADCICETLFSDTSIGFVLACRFDAQEIGKEILLKIPHSLQKQVILLGESNQIIELIEASDLVIFPALKMVGKFQPPMVLMESLTLGVPILTSNIIDINLDLNKDVLRRVSISNWNEFGRDIRLSLIKSDNYGKNSDNYFEDMAIKYEKKYINMTNKYDK